MLNRIKHTFTSTIVYSLGNISLKIIGLIMLPIYTDHLSVDEYGRWAILEITSQVLVILVGVRLSTAMIRHYSEENDARRKGLVLFSTVVMTLLSILLFTIPLHSLSAWTSSLYFDSTRYTLLIHLLIVWASIEVVNKLSLDFLRIIQKPGLFVLATVVRFVTVLSLNIYFVAFRGMGIKGILLGQLSGSILLLLSTFPFIIRKMRWGVDLKLWGDLMKYGLPLVFSSIAMFLLTMGDRYVIKAILEYERVGIYAMSYKLASVVKLTLVQAFQLGFIPIVFNMFGKTDIRRFVSKIFTYYSFVLLFASLALSVFAREIIYTFARDPEYYESFVYIPYMLLASCFQAQQYVFTIGLHYKKKLHYLVWITISAALMDLGLNWILLPRMDLYGSIVAVLVSSLWMVLSTFWLANRQYRIPYEVRKTVLLFLTAIGLFSLSLLLTKVSLAPRILLKLLIVALYPFILYFMGFYESVELQRIRQIWDTWKHPGKWKQNVRRLLDTGLSEDQV